MQGTDISCRLVLAAQEFEQKFKSCGSSVDLNPVQITSLKSMTQTLEALTEVKVLMKQIQNHVCYNNFFTNKGNLV